MAISPSTELTDLITFNILSNGSRIPDTIDIVGFEIEQVADASDQAFITIYDGRPGGEGFHVANSKTFELENHIEIKLGYNNTMTTVFKGSIHGQQLAGNANEPSQLNVICNTGTNAINSKRPADVNLSKTPVLKLTYGVDVLEFELLLHHDDPMQIEGVVSFQGFANTNVNDTLILENFSDKFNTTYVISRVIHHVADGDWTTTAFIAGKL
ncbi:MAG: hypothetical protein V7719_04495 [Psychroserpens sp.]|uniref:hypothetical protein n=1 Tax=Psychroserpens sp. TaxID=2020870 RepID=UPI0030028F05